jgi:hypothetical protein
MSTVIFNKECIQNRSALLKKYYPSEFSPMQIVHITEGEIRCITSSLKSKNVSNMANYRPISLLPVFSKVFAKAMYYRFSHHLQANSILATEQCGFKNGLSTEHKTISLTDSTIMAWNKKIQIGGIFCELTKAFGYASHDVLIAKHKYYGIQESTLNWFKSCL